MHGDANEMLRLKVKLKQVYENKGMEVLMPKNTQAVQLEFRGDKVAKVPEIVS